MRNYFTFNNEDSCDYGLWISGSGTYDAPKRDVSKYSVPGRNGDLLIDNHRFNNIPLSYPAFISKDFYYKFDDFKAFMLSQSGYLRLEDTYHPNEYRMAQFVGPMNPDVKVLNVAGEFEIEFDCKPQRWLKVGEKAIEITSSTTINNPTLYTAKPLVRVYGTGTLVIGSETIEINDVNSYVDIDCEIMDAYKDSTNCNSDIELTSGGFFELEPGLNTITMDNSITSIELTPRWWTI